jgi:hypothetical protein
VAKLTPQELRKMIAASRQLLLPMKIKKVDIHCNAIYLFTDSHHWLTRNGQGLKIKHMTILLRETNTARPVTKHSLPEH